MNFLSMIVFLVTCSIAIDSLSIGQSHAESIQSTGQVKVWYHNAWDRVGVLFKSVEEFFKSKVDRLKRPKTSARHICIWKMCSKPLKGSMKTSIPKKNTIIYRVR